MNLKLLNMFLMILSGNKDVSFTDILIAVLEAKALEKLFQSFSECFTIKSNISMPYHCCYSCLYCFKQITMTSNNSIKF